MPAKRRGMRLCWPDGSNRNLSSSRDRGRSRHGRPDRRGRTETCPLFSRLQLELEREREGIRDRARFRCALGTHADPDGSALSSSDRAEQERSEERVDADRLRRERRAQQGDTDERQDALRQPPVCIAPIDETLSRSPHSESARAAMGPAGCPRRPLRSRAAAGTSGTERASRVRRR